MSLKGGAPAKNAYCRVVTHIQGTWLLHEMMLPAWICQDLCLLLEVNFWYCSLLTCGHSLHFAVCPGQQIG